MIITTRNGHFIEECEATQANYHRLKSKYGNEFYAFCAAPSEVKSTGPLRRAVSPRKFAMVAAD